MGGREGLAEGPTRRLLKKERAPWICGGQHPCNHPHVRGPQVYKSEEACGAGEEQGGQ